MTTCIQVMRQQLLSYSPTRDLLPLLAAYRVEGGKKGKGKGKAGYTQEDGNETASSFDVDAIERALAHSVLSRATQLIVHVAVPTDIEPANHPPRDDPVFKACHRQLPAT